MTSDTLRFRSDKTWFKGNTHIHTTRSDGGTDPADVAKLYASAGYDFLFFTDHMKVSAEWRNGSEYPLAVFDGVEIHGNDKDGSFYHVVCLGRFEEVDSSKSLDESIGRCREQGGLIILAHPFWTGNDLEDAQRHGFDGIEIYNHVCRWLNGKSSSLFLWDEMLASSGGVLGIACDDAHLRPEHPGWNGGWIMVNADSCTDDSVLGAIRAGRYYSTQGPEIRGISIDGDTIQVETTEVSFMRLVGSGSQGDRIGSFDGVEITRGEFQLPRSFDYVRLEIEDRNGRRAWTNPLF